MKKLTLEHLAGYLPYGLQIYWEELKDTVPIPWTLTAKHLDMVLMNQNKPILHPLSDLTKEIEVNGEKFVPITRLRPDSFNSEGRFSYDYYKQARVFILKNNDTGEELHIYTTNFISVSTRKHIFSVSDYRIIQKLYEWHFDIHGLIDEGLAIDINKL